MGFWIIRRWPLTLGIAAGAAALMLCEPAAGWLQYDRSLVLRGQIWRIATCHLTHWSNVHALWSGLAFVALAGMCEVRSRLLTATTICISSVAIGGAMLLFLPKVEVFRGLSGIDSALLGLLAVMILRSRTSASAKWLALAAIVLFALKVSGEMLGLRSVFLGKESEVIPLPAAHLIGFVTGLCVGFCPMKSRVRPGN
ncbi:MAG TPA: rhombosortase [Humisphaera sp.]|jgi:rhomboid family GlyGly-CTERM serine protease|nr:rhombosortase [Humisphaera sp.]